MPILMRCWGTTAGARGDHIKTSVVDVRTKYLLGTPRYNTLCNVSYLCNKSDYVPQKSRENYLRFAAI